MVSGLRREIPRNTDHQSAPSEPGRARRAPAGLRSRAIYLTVTVATMAFVLGGRDGDAAVRQARDTLAEWAGAVPAAARSAAGWGAHVAAAAPVGAAQVAAVADVAVGADV